MKDLKYEHQSIKVGGWWVGWRVGGWRVHGVGGCRVHGVGGCGGVGGGGVGWVVVGSWWGGWLEGSWGDAYTHPPMNSYNVKTFHFMKTHPPIKYIQSVTVTIHILWMVHGVGGAVMVGGFMGWVSG